MGLNSDLDMPQNWQSEGKRRLPESRISDIPVFTSSGSGTDHIKAISNFVKSFDIHFSFVMVVWPDLLPMS